jgi:hypothetical protein
MHCEMAAAGRRGGVGEEVVASVKEDAVLETFYNRRI